MSVFTCGVDGTQGLSSLLLSLLLLSSSSFFDTIELFLAREGFMENFMALL